MILFVKTRYHYDSYRDYWKLVELSGFDTCYVDQIDVQSENTYIVTPVNGEFRPHMTHRLSQGSKRARIIWWNLERPDGGNWALADIGKGASNELDEISKYVDEVWCSDRWFASLDKRLKYVTLGSHEGLVEYPRVSGDRFDICTLSCTTHRRSLVFDQLARQRKRITPGGWGQARHEALCTSKLVLNVHQHNNPAPIGEPLRIAVAAAYKLPFVTETLGDPFPLVQNESLIMGRYDELVEVTKNALDYDVTSIGEGLYQKMVVDYSFRKCVMEALES